METVTRVYDSYGQARQAVADLEAAGVASSDINLIANKYVCDETSDLDEPASGAAPDDRSSRLAVSSQTYLLAIRLMSELATPAASRSATAWRAWP